MKHMNTEDFDGSYFKNEFNSHRLAHVVNMASIYQMLAVDTQKWAAWERQYVGPEELFGGDGVENGARTKKQKSVATTKKTDFGGGEGEEKFAGEEDAETEDEDDGEDFELIDLTELAQPQPLKSNSKGAKNTAAAESEEAENVPHCESCGERDLRNLVQLQSCGHHFCSVCLGTGFNHQLKAKSVPLQCLVRCLL